ncbi:MFS transporter [Actinomadura sp. LD22]|uniref:MFS transporter n=1 Tax=Actinomadura physcomitrii TaxID=2650748 RepID=A0A6I4MRC2_9ACTN|nr:MFS transporter [Actinomadura physcomitrii]
MVIGSGIATSVAPGPMVLATLGVFLLPITKETGFSRATVTGAYSVAAIGTAIGLLIVGRLLDRYAVRYISVPSMVGVALSMAGMVVAPPVVAVYMIPWFFVGVFASGVMIPFTKAIVSWFDNRRGLAIGVQSGMLGLGNSLTPLLAAALIVGLGWRGAYGVLALITLVVGLGAITALVRVRAEKDVRGRLIKETQENGREISLGVPGLTSMEALRSRHFWLICFGLGLVGIVITGVQVNLVPLMSDRGLPVNEAVFLLTIMGIASTVGRVIGGFILDRVHATITGTIVILAPIAGLFFLHPPFGSVAVAVALIGLALGIELDLLPLLVTRYLGMRAFGEIIGVLQAVFVIGTAFGPLLLGVGYDTFGSYDPVIPVLIGVLVVSALLIAVLGKYRYPAVKGFDKVAQQDELAAAELLSEIAENEGPGRQAEPGRTRQRGPSSSWCRRLSRVLTVPCGAQLLRLNHSDRRD